MTEKELLDLSSYNSNGIIIFYSNVSYIKNNIVYLNNGKIFEIDSKILEHFVIGKAKYDLYKSAIDDSFRDIKLREEVYSSIRENFSSIKDELKNELSKVDNLYTDTKNKVLRQTSTIVDKITELEKISEVDFSSKMDKLDKILNKFDSLLRD